MNKQEVIKAFIIMLPIAIFMVWYAGNADRSLRNYAIERYTSCMIEATFSNDPRVASLCERLHPDNQ